MAREPYTQTRRERQAAARLDQILDAAARLFAERGFHRTTTRDIAEAADVSEGTLYNYFDNKNDLLFGILERLTESQMGQPGFADPQSSDPRQFFAQVLNDRQTFMQNNGVMMQAILSEILANAELRERYSRQMLQPTLQSVEQNLAARLSLGQIRPIDLAASTRILSSISLSLFLLQVLGDPLVQSQWDKLVETIVTMIFDGIAARPTGTE